MPRIRSLKPDFFLDEDLGELPLWVRVLYEGLWCQADKAGRLEDRPLKLKAVIFPYDKYDVNDGLNQLAKPKSHSPKHTPFIMRYIVDGERYIQILSWELHQNPHHTEKDSSIPRFNGEITVKEPLDKGNVLPTHYQETMNNDQGTMTREVIGYLNEKTGKNFSPSTKGYKTHISARCKEGRSLDDFKRVIDTKSSQWLNDDSMNKFLRPQTLFGEKMDGYLNESCESVKKPWTLADEMEKP